jgi:ABC-type transporter Mla subunit MlaD
MRRILAMALCLLAAGLVIALPATGDDDGPYLVRAIFDNGAFVVEGEEVRIAGARVGSVKSVEVSRGDEVTSRDGSKLPGKAVVVLQIDDDGFKDFRQDATCRIRPQSLLGEKYVDCTPTQPRAAGTEPPPELEVIEDGPGEGERLLTVENNGTSVDIDLFNNINRFSYRERFRLILNELGAGVAGRGEDLGEVIDRANPALQQTDRVLKILADQNQELASLASNGDAVLEPLARERQHITSFMANSNVAAEATAERKVELERQFELLPKFLRELRLTMKDLRGVTDNATPVLRDTGAVAKDITRATRNLGPLSRLATPALTTLGDAGQAAGPKLVAADPLTVDLTEAAVHTAPLSQNLKGILRTFEQTNGIKNLLDFIRNATTSQNGFDSRGHFLRTNVLVTTCPDSYPNRILSTCVINWKDGPALTSGATGVAKSSAKPKAEAGVEGLELSPVIPELLPPAELEEPPEEPTDTTPDPSDDAGTDEGEETAQASRRRGAAPMDMRSAEALLYFLLGGSA